MVFRQLKPSEAAFLKEMLYDALFVPNGQPPFPKNIIEQPELSKYMINWGEGELDLAIVCELENKLIGAIWARALPASNPGYGFVDEDTPEFSIAVKPAYRNKGIGTKLILKLLEQYKQLGVKVISLSVAKQNPVINLYQRLGFQIIKQEGTAYTMFLNLKATETL